MSIPATIGGTIDCVALTGRDRHKPADAATMRAAVRDLAARGLTPRDIAASLGLTEAAVRQLLAWEAA
jgi:hypothetical protein